MNAQRAQIKKEHPDLTLGQITKKATEMWNKLSAEEKKVFSSPYSFLVYFSWGSFGRTLIFLSSIFCSFYV
jgi:hypothetical protein